MSGVWWVVGVWVVGVCSVVWVVDVCSVGWMCIVCENYMSTKEMLPTMGKV